MSVRTGQSGFTIVEVMVAILVLTVGITALVGSSAVVTRQVGRGRVVTLANQIAEQKLDDLRRAAAIKDGSGNRCTDAGFASGGPTTKRGVSYTWTVGTTGSARSASVTATYKIKGGTRSLTISTYIGCV
ncbi:MAG TPA: prepilin-type N-terminal cleavage/methylation domain-containing protein [Gemmatimonadales bacterium]|nr:prepilin-type N-terminal cleavage/methylation domain-containing protein [Gemmatimonadales bacterium]